MSHLSQMVGLALHNFVSAATGIALAAALVRGIARQSARTLGNFWVDLVRRNVAVKGREVRLTATEYALLRLFVRHAGRVLTHGQILRHVWGPAHESQTHFTCAFTWPICAKSSKRIRPSPSCSSPSRVLGTAWSALGHEPFGSAKAT
jgi:hypothetical protein